MIKRYVLIILLGFLITSIADAGLNVTENDVAIGGYDPVAYFTQGKAVKGNPEFRYRNDDDIFWLFDSAQHREMFLAESDKYTPQYGGFCAFAMGYRVKAPANPKYFSVYEGKLYLNQNQSIQNRWLNKKDALIPLADQYWPSFK